MKPFPVIAILGKLPMERLLGLPVAVHQADYVEQERTPALQRHKALREGCPLRDKPNLHGHVGPNKINHARVTLLVSERIKSRRTSLCVRPVCFAKAKSRAASSSVTRIVIDREFMH